MSIRSGAPYADRLEDDGRVLIYEGHDVPKNFTRKPPKSVDQEMTTPGGRLTENGRFFEAARAVKSGAPAEPDVCYAERTPVRPAQSEAEIEKSTFHAVVAFCGLSSTAMRWWLKSSAQERAHT